MKKIIVLVGVVMFWSFNGFANLTPECQNLVSQFSLQESADNCEATSAPYSVDFENVMVPDLPGCTSTENLGNGNNWETAIFNNYGFQGKVLTYKHSANTVNAWFYTQGISLEVGTQYQISYKYGSNPGIGGDNLKVVYGVTAKAASMQYPIADYQEIEGGVAHNGNISFTVLADDIYYIGFNAYSTANPKSYPTNSMQPDSEQWDLYLDEIQIVEMADCNPPTEVEIIDITENSASVTWTGDATATMGYDIEVYLANTGTLEFGGYAAPGETSAEITGLTASTDYDLYVISDCEDGAIAASSVTNFTTTGLSVNDNDLPKINYFPNPVKDQLTINALGRVDMLTVTNLLGQTVMQVYPRSNEISLDMSTLPVGTYILKANIESAVSHFKVIKE